MPAEDNVCPELRRGKANVPPLPAGRGKVPGSVYDSRCVDVGALCIPEITSDDVEKYFVDDVVGKNVDSSVACR